MRARPFAQVDVFGASPLGGNPVAVVLDGEGIDDEGMHRFTRWTNLSETTFLTPPTVDGADYRVRIFTPGRELPFAGHPTLGSCHAWLNARGDDGRDRVIQECGAGLVELRRGEDGAFAFAAPPLVRYEPAEESVVERIAAAVGIPRDHVLDAHWVDNGPGWVAILLASADEVLALTPGVSDLDIGVAGPLSGLDAALEVRAFFPKDGILGEDPVTGSLNASLAKWLTETGRIETPYTARQGTALGRDGRVHVVRDGDGILWVGGATATTVEGTAWI